MFGKIASQIPTVAGFIDKGFSSSGGRATPPSGTTAGMHHPGVGDPKSRGGTPSGAGDSAGVEGRGKGEAPGQADAEGAESDCFITTAVVDTMGEEDNGRTLTILRDFRDTHMRSNPLVEEYKRVAPGIVEAINKRQDAEMVYRRFYVQFITPAVAAIEEGQLDLAVSIYISLVGQAKELAYA